jgi:PAS domain-containing protein
MKPDELHEPLFPGLMGSVFEAVPVAMVVVDPALRVLKANPRAVQLAGGRLDLRNMAPGEALGCVHAGEAPGGCGHSEPCNYCGLRQTAEAALRSGAVLTERAAMELHRPFGPQTAHLDVTAVPFEQEGGRFALLILDDLSELVELRGIVPVCAWCKRIRSGEEYWESVEEYLARHLSVDVTHSLCEDCMRRILLDEEGLAHS